MRLFTKSALTALLIATPMVPAMATDAITLPTSAPTAEIPLADASFDWNGFYAGVFGVAQFSPDRDGQWGAGVTLGVNATFDFFLVGGEVAVQGLTGADDQTAYGEILAKGGVLVTDDIAVYAATGLGSDFGQAVEQDVLLGGGVEMAVADSISLRAQYLHGFPITGDNAKDQVTLGANFHF
jgi:outer membrane immunogenic protein